MDSLPSGFSNKDFKLLVIEHEIFHLTIKGKPIHPNIEALSINKDKNNKYVRAMLEIIPYSYKCDAKVFSPYVDKENLEIYQDNQVFPCFYENQSYQLVIESKTDNKVQFYHDNKYLREAVDYVGNEKILAGVLNFRSEIGYTEFEVRNGKKVLLKVKIEIFPAKMDYKNDYINLIREVNEEVYNLAYDFLGRTYFSTKLRHTNNQTMTEYYSILISIFDKFNKAMERITINPHHKLHTTTNIVEIQKARSINLNTINWIRQNPQILRKHSKGIRINDEQYIPDKVLENRKEISYDTFENRFVKWIITKIIIKSRQLIKQYRTLYEKTSRFDEKFISRINTIINKCREYLNLGFFREVSDLSGVNTISLVMQMASGYREVYKYYLMLIKGLSIQSDVFNLSLKQLWLLYEYWCFLKLNRLLSDKYHLITHNLIKVRNNGLYLNLNTARDTKLTYRNPINGEKFTLLYNVVEGIKDTTVAQKPDTILSLEKEGSNIIYKYIFDAKYRINPAISGTGYGDRYKIPGPQEDDINIMHRYRDAIISEAKASREYHRTIFGAYVLFPFDKEEIYKEHRLYKSIRKVNVGGLPFLPGHTKLMEQFIDKLIVQTPQSVQEDVIVNEGTKSYLQTIYSNRSMIIGSVKSRVQLEKNLKNKFYYIPYKNIDLNNKNIEYIGLYQSKKLFDKEAGIKYFGKVKRWEILKRNEISELPKDDDSLYVKFIVEKWEERKEKIEALESGISGSHIYTTKALFDRAEVYPMLNLKSKLEIRLWDELSRIRNYIGVVKDYESIYRVFEISNLDMTISLKSDEIVAERKNKEQTFKIEDIRTSPKYMINLIIGELFNKYETRY